MAAASVLKTTLPDWSKVAEEAMAFCTKQVGLRLRCDFPILIFFFKNLRYLCRGGGGDDQAWEESRFCWCRRSHGAASEPNSADELEWQLKTQSPANVAAPWPLRVRSGLSPQTTEGVASLVEGEDK